jgi:hypothetical protein
MLPRIALLSLLIALLACNTVSTAVPPTAMNEPTAEPTSVPPTDAPTPTVPSEPTAIPGWLTYHNAMFGYAFDYPPEATLTTSGVTGYPTEELPAGLEPGQYIATLEATYTEALCAGIELPAAFMVLQAPDDAGGRYGGPCGISGIGVYDLKTEESSMTIGGVTYPLRTTRLYEVGTDTLVNEFAGVVLKDGTRFNFASTWEMHGLTYEDYLADRAIILQVMSSYRAVP